MPSEVIRCTDCGAAFKGVPSWLSTAKVKFSCTNCPKRPSRLARFEPAPVPVAVLESDPDLEGPEIEEMDEDADLDMSDELDDDIKDEKDL